MQRELQRSVTEIRRSRNARARGSSIGPGARAPARPGIGSGPRGWFNGITFVAMEELYSDPMRSEEHTSELQSRLHLVCRLLLEKKNQKCGPTKEDTIAGLRASLAMRSVMRISRWRGGFNS